jgi:hypothetical protein
MLIRVSRWPSYGEDHQNDGDDNHRAWHQEMERQALNDPTPCDHQRTHRVPDSILYEPLTPLDDDGEEGPSTWATFLVILLRSASAFGVRGIEHDGEEAAKDSIGAQFGSEADRDQVVHADGVVFGQRVSGMPEKSCEGLVLSVVW